MPCDINKIRDAFPVLSQRIKGKLPIYFDNACVTLKPTEVIEAMSEYYLKHPSCHKRTVHKFGQATTSRYERARRGIQGFINAREAQEIIFTRNATEAINLIANSFNFEKGDAILTTDMEHNSNLIPWQVLTKKKEVRHRVLSLDKDSLFDLARFKDRLSEGVRLVSLFHTSHITGTTLPIGEIVKLSHEHGALVLVDGAQSIPHRRIDVQKLGVDFFVFSFHKMLGPAGMGCLYVKRSILEDMSPFLVGGETVDDVDYESCAFSSIPERFEAGLQNYSGAMGAEAAVNYLKRIDAADIRRHELELNKLVTDEIINFPRVRLLGPEDPELRGSIINFYLEDMDSGELSLLLDQTSNIMLRSGVHCCHAWYKKRNIPATIRASFYLYNTIEEAEVFIQALKKIIKYF